MGKLSYSVSTSDEIKFKDGDRIRAIAPCDGSSFFVGCEGVVRVVHSGWKLPVEVLFDNGRMWNCEGKSLINLSYKKTFMNKVSIMMKKLLDADTQKLVKAGFINGDLELTTAGQAALLSELFMNNKTAMVKMAEEVIAEEEKNK